MYCSGEMVREKKSLNMFSTSAAFKKIFLQLVDSAQVGPAGMERQLYGMSLRATLGGLKIHGNH